VSVVRVGLFGGRRERTTVPWPGFAMEDSKGERMGIAGCRIMAVVLFEELGKRRGFEEDKWWAGRRLIKLERRSEG
jgi:hypothetical protein